MVLTIYKEEHMLLKAWKRFSNRPRPKKLVRLFEKGMIDVAAVTPYNPRSQSGASCVCWAVKGVGPDGAYRFSPSGTDWVGVKEGVVPKAIVKTLGLRPIDTIHRSAKMLSEKPRAGIKSVCDMDVIKKDFPGSHSYIERFQTPNK